MLVGYRGYIEQVSGSLPGKELVPDGTGQEMERAARAVDLASEGRAVVVVPLATPVSMAWPGLFSKC